ncbi:MAG: hypothetical protein ICV51_20495, partial [Flavisolibacter sp.]|nr:hypothetical protein [Flavisolibacter sp.]
VQRFVNGTTIVYLPGVLPPAANALLLLALLLELHYNYFPILFTKNKWLQ